jgi:hypothetical protein
MGPSLVTCSLDPKFANGEYPVTPLENIGFSL